MNTEYDLVIIGGGLVGLSLLLACRKLNLKIALIEAKSPQENTGDQVLDQRSLVLALGSKLFYEDIGIWDEIEPHTTEIKKIIISEQGKFSKVFLKHNDFLVPALGYVINIDKLYQMILQNTGNYPDGISGMVKIYSPYKVSDLKLNPNSVELCTNNGDEELYISGKIIVAADGGRSYIRDLLKIPYEQHDYQQVAMIANVVHELENSNTAYERFSKQGPFALLPRVNNKNISGIVWPYPTAELEKIKALSDQEILSSLQSLFGYKLGKFLSVGARQFFPLWRINSKELYKNRIVLMGNAANNIHPVGGQGFNLGLRDVKTFSQLLADDQQNIIGEQYSLDSITKLFKKYAALRKADHNNLLISTHGLLNIFASDNYFVKIARNLGMTVVNNSYLLRNLITEKSMGL